MTNVVKFPYSSSRRVHSKKPRRSKNGTPEERAAKAAAANTTPATVIEISSDNQRLAKAAKDGPTALEFFQQMRAYLVQEFARGKNVDQIFDSLEGTYRRTDEAKQRFRERRASETSDFPVNLPVPDLGQSVLNLAAEDRERDH
jgi:hypothetical protein